MKIIIKLILISISLFIVYITTCLFSSIEFKHSFRKNGYKWKTYKLIGKEFNPTLLIPKRGSFIIEPPFFNDTNHIYPGIGAINLILYNYIADIVLYPFFDSNFSPRYLKSIVRQMPFSVNLYGKKIKLKMTLENYNLRNSHIYFWYQSRLDNGKFVNYYYNEPVDLLRDINGYKVLSLNKNSNWICMGSSLSRADYYDCQNLAPKTAICNVDLGFIIYPAIQNEYEVKNKKNYIYFEEIILE